MLLWVPGQQRTLPLTRQVVRTTLQQDVTPTTDGTTAICDFSDLTFSNVSITARGALIYNDTQADKAVCVLDFGGDKTATAGDFTISFPTANASSAIIRIA